MKILIAGVAGMLGSHLEEVLINKKYTLYGINNLSIGKKNIKLKNKFL